MIFLCHFFSAASFAWHWVNYSGEIPLLGCIVFGSIFRVFEFFIELDHFSLVVLRIDVGRTVILSFWSYWFGFTWNNLRCCFSFLPQSLSRCHICHLSLLFHIFHGPILQNPLTRLLRINELLIQIFIVLIQRLLMLMHLLLIHRTVLLRRLDGRPNTSAWIIRELVSSSWFWGLSLFDWVRWGSISRFKLWFARFELNSIFL